jgi:uncharacterized protein YxeA
MKDVLFTIICFFICIYVALSLLPRINESYDSYYIRLNKKGGA